MRLDGKPLDNMFSTRDQADHKHLKQPVAGSFALSSIRQLEPLVDECTDIFIEEMAKRSPAPVDFSTWLQWYAFDVIGSITFLKRFGFMEQGKDVEHLIENLEGGLTYISTICFTPELHGWLLGNDTLMKFLSLIPAVRRKDPFQTVLRVSSCFALRSTGLMCACRLQEARSKHMTRSRETTPEETCCLGYASSGPRTRSAWVREILSII
jgi:hypothetical protein